jgi:hypothetical protein
MPPRKKRKAKAERPRPDDLAELLRRAAAATGDERVKRWLLALASSGETAQGPPPSPEGQSA